MAGRGGADRERHARRVVSVMRRPRPSLRRLRSLRLLLPRRPSLRRLQLLLCEPLAGLGDLAAAPCARRDSSAARPPRRPGATPRSPTHRGVLARLLLLLLLQLVPAALVLLLLPPPPPAACPRLLDGRLCAGAAPSYTSSSPTCPRGHPCA